MLELARATDGTPVQMATVAERQGISRKYLHILLTALKNAGLVRSLRGAGGGFALMRPPREIRLSEILRALEGPLSPVDCVEDGQACRKSGVCPARRVWQEVTDALETALDGVTLESVAANKKRRPARSGIAAKGAARRVKSGKKKTVAPARRSKAGAK